MNQMTKPVAAEVDPITLLVIRGSFETIAEEMGHVLYRMSFSSIIRESQDLGAGLFDTNFNTLCESESTPMHIGSIPGYLRGEHRFPGIVSLVAATTLEAKNTSAPDTVYLTLTLPF